jgi:hypothetical protein
MPTILTNTGWRLRSTDSAALDGRGATRLAMTAVVIVALHKTIPLPSLRGMKWRSNPGKHIHTHHPDEFQLNAPQYWRRCSGWPRSVGPRHDDCQGMRGGHILLPVFASGAKQSS